MRRAKAATAGALSILLLAALALGVLPDLVPGPPTPGPPPSLGDALWTIRSLDLAVQAFILLTGVLAIVLLLRRDAGGGRHG